MLWCRTSMAVWIFAEKFKGNYQTLTLLLVGHPWRRGWTEEAWDHADLLHNILNSLRGEAVPEQGAMHGSAIQVSSQITSSQPMPDDMCTVQRFVFCQHWSEAVGGRYHLWGVGRIYPTPRSPMTGTARVSHQPFWRAPKKYRCYSRFVA
jgi:hypothetical protein